ncbi:transcriptional regulator, IclR family [Anaerovirgula multivorans]|uniref:Glycerol operon regulatory protein n=1 Tax=Anaerovirgula multivorans TaxID=312168 RepID=A0A239AYV8_9FIRM|nr:IclR family transcriptional regulator [Anaerovirgula multivorans]SNS00204.1 transcriptional regulator, IclR family [Anaerovirgula multivorans]
MQNEIEPKVKSLYKALKLLDYFDAEHAERGITEIAELSGYLKSTVHNIMQTFEQCGFVRKSSSSGKYKLGAKVLELSHVYYLSNNMIKVIKGFMKEISGETGETVFLGTLSGNEVVYVEAEYPANSMRTGQALGFKASLYCTGIGKAILAFLPKEEIEAVLKGELKQFTPNTIKDKQLLLKELEMTLNRGYAIDNMEHEYGIRCVAVPIKSRNEEVRYAMSITGPSLRMTDEIIEKYSKLLLKKSEEIYRLL